MNTTTIQQKDHPIMHYPGSIWRRWLFKAPLILWRLGLGSLLGKKMIVMTHIGRKSGLTRRTMTEYQRGENGSKYIPCAFGERAQWYKNMQANPHITIQTSDGVENVSVRRVTDNDELRIVYDTFMKYNPMMLKWYFNTLDIKFDVEDFLAKKDRVHLLTFDNTIEPTPPPLETVWVGLWKMLVNW